MFDAPNPGVLLLACLLAGASASLLAYVVLPLLTTGVVPVTAALDAVQRRARRDRQIQEAGLFRFMLAALPVLTPLVRRLRLTAIQESLAERYAQAGWPGGLEDDEVLTIALVLGLALGLPVTLLLLLIAPPFAPVGVLFLVLGPGLASARLAGMGEQRSREITRTMPYVLDMLVLTMRAGAALPAALERVTLDFAGTHIGREFRAVLTDLERGTTLKEALTNLSHRAPVPVLLSFTESLIQATELGQPVADTLERLSDRVRQIRVQEAVETAGRAKVMVLIPGMLVFLAVLLLLFAPFIVRFYYGGYSSI